MMYTDKHLMFKTSVNNFKNKLEIKTVLIFIMELKSSCLFTEKISIGVTPTL